MVVVYNVKAYVIYSLFYVSNILQVNEGGFGFNELNV